MFPPSTLGLLAPLCLVNVATAHLAAFTDGMFCPEASRQKPFKHSRG